MDAKRSFLASAWLPLISWIIFGVLFLVLYKSLGLVAPTDISNGTIADLFSKYSLYVGFILGFVIMLLTYVLYLIKSFLPKLGFMTPLFFLLGQVPFLYLAYNLRYLEPRYTDIARGLISYVSAPFWWSSLSFVALSLLWLILSFFKKSA